MKYLTLLALCRVADAGAMGITRRLDTSKCADEPGATLPGGWDCARIAEYIAGSDVHSCRWAGPWLSVMVAPRLAEEAAAKCPLSCNECAPDDVDAVDDRVEDNGPEAGLAKDDPAYAPEGTSPDDVIERAAVSNQFNLGPRPVPSVANPCRSCRVSSDEPKADPIPTRVPSPQVVLIVKMPQAVYAIWPILLLWSAHGARMLQVD